MTKVSENPFKVSDSERCKKENFKKHFKFLEFSFLCKILNRGEARPELNGALRLWREAGVERGKGAQINNKELLIHKI